MRLSKIITTIVLLFFCLFSNLAAHANIVLDLPKTSSSCSAPTEYRKNLARFAKAIKAEQDFSCLTDIPSITSRLSQYQLVDIGSVAELDDAWKLSINELKLKSYLNDRKLLLLGDSFSRVKAAANCALLKKNGFTQTKILVGGAELWRQYKNNRPPDLDSKIISAKDFMYEYFNGSVVVVAANKEIVKIMSMLGVDKVKVWQSSQSLTSVITENSLNGYLPVVVVGEIPGANHLFVQYPNLYLLNGGITALENQFKIDVMTDLSRFDTLGVSACEAL